MHVLVVIAGGLVLLLVLILFGWLWGGNSLGMVLATFDKGRIEAILTKDSDLNYFQIRVKYLGRSQET
ncbi:hypothetical protein [Pseudomonas chlororaphis]|uniref:Uncharacterized protein n=1 Tax=Pseudomonas chlororaphis TaxID=587753 RepID=A0AAX3FN36_9PSED|nr:hypothetical protein [Pseudomonas chlororaphis]AZC37574.1 hypothetical protein C4K37_3187 [Pseudomonas chlororaphis subsp. piscium]AZC44122.1 hypothetical protein C4K36_3197 [Pseudomonas chlororaphis subsp. piscium]WDG69773.1 hypothetical protein PUP65_16770 [Pseudomonas chlororaphis]WDH26401.1 hypothetical protein PUP81_17550 [Pseudomonas chlororaphis]WDH68299.1 hypothetical protein PUP78_16755 [Pseudomonas chlororaphis]